MNKTLKLILQAVLTVCILVLTYLVVESIMQPVRFDKAVDGRTERVVQNLKDIRSAQLAYKAMNDRYTGSFDTLISFVKEGEIPVVYIIQDPNDTTFTKTITDTIDFINVQDSLFNDREEFTAENLRFVPYGQGEEFEMEANEIEKGGVIVDVIEVKTAYEVFMKGLDKQMIINKIKKREDIDKYAGLKFGSMKEPSTNGNWE